MNITRAHVPPIRWRFRAVKRSIQLDLLLVFTLIAVIPVMLVNFYYFQTMRMFIQDKVVSYNDALLRQNSRQIEGLLSQISTANKQITSYLISGDIASHYGIYGPIKTVLLVKNTEAYLKDLHRSFQASMEIYVKFDNGDLYTTNSNVERDLLLANDETTRIHDQRYYETILPSHQADYADHIPDSPKQAVVSFIKVITVNQQPKVTAIIQIDLDYSEIQGILAPSNASGDATITLYDPHGNIVFGDSEALSTTTIDIADHVITTLPVGRTAWRLASSLPRQSLYSALDVARQTWLIIMLITLLVSCAVAYLLSARITSPIRKLVSSMKMVGEGRFDYVAINSMNAEIETLCHSYNVMVDQIGTLMDNVRENEAEKTNAQLKALQSQINPHFLYNTLDTVRSIALQHRVPTIADICKSLGDMFRYSVGQASDFVTVGDEIQHVTNYMKIQAKRFGDKIQFETLIDDDLLCARSIKLILQPLVENAVYHGIEMKRGNAHVFISAYTEDRILIINIVDDGLGIEPELVARLNATFARKAPGKIWTGLSDSGIGLMNVDSRIKLHFGDRFGLFIVSTPGHQTRIQIRTPLLR